MIVEEKLSQFYELVCPKLLGNDFAKKVISVMMHTNPAQGEKFHVMLIGNPASGKSEILMEAAELVPNSVYVGKKTTPTGMVEVMMSANGGILSADEFDKVYKQSRDMMLEAMQSGKVSIHQYGLHNSFNARCNVLAGCNPRNYVLSKSMPVHRQTIFSLALLTRFHLIIPFYKVDKELYPDIARNQNRDPDDDRQRRRDITSHIADVRSKLPRVIVSDDIMMEAGRYVCDLETISPMKDMISPRLIEGFRSCLLAHARMNKRNKVNKDDLKNSIKIFEEAYYPK